MAGPSESSRLSVAVIFRDAADSLRLTLASVSRIADEIIAVDTGSSDKSKEVAQEFKANLCDFPWNDDFSAARNFALSRVTGDWVLWLDAGETLDEKDAVALKAFLNGSAESDCAYYLVVRIAADGTEGDTDQVARLRLVPNRSGIAFEGRVRESLLGSLASLNMRVNALPWVIHRSGEVENDNRRRKRRAQRNMRLVELDCQEFGNTSDRWNCMGETFQVLGHAQKAEACYRQSIQHKLSQPSEQLEAYYGMLTSLEHQAQTAHEAGKSPVSSEATDGDSVAIVRQTQLAVCMQALEAFPLDAQLLCALGGYLHHQGSADLASKAYATAYQYGQVDPTLWHRGDIQEVAGVCHAVTLRLLKRDEEAIGFLEKAVVDNPNSIKLRRQLIDIYVCAGNREQALAHVGKMPKGTPHKEAFRSAVRGACYGAEKNWIAAKAYLQTAYSHGCRDTLCLRWLAISLVIGGEFDAARPILEVWRGLEPENEECMRLLEKISEPKQRESAGPVSADRALRIDAPAKHLLGTAIPLNLGITTPQG